MFPLGFNFEKGKMLFPGSLYGQYQGVDGECINGYMTCDCDGWILFLDCSNPGTIDCQCIDSVIITPPSDFTCPICGQDPCVCGYYDPCSYGSPDYSDCACLGINCDYGGCDPSSPYYDECTCLGINCDDGGGDGGGGDGDGTNDGIYNFDTSNLSTTAQEKFDTTIEELEQNCFLQQLLSSLDSISIRMDSTINAEAGYNPSTNSVIYKDESKIDAYNTTGEMFHAYQDTFYGNYLDDLGALAPGRSNIEFEEKFAGLLARVIAGSYFAEIESLMGVGQWIDDLISNNNEEFPSSFTPEQSTQYMIFLNNFREWNATNPAGDPRYATPVDPNLPSYPAAVIEIINNSTCYENN